MGVGVSLTFACSWNPFALGRLLWSAIILGNVPSLTVSVYNVFHRYPWNPCSFLKGNGK